MSAARYVTYLWTWPQDIIVWLLFFLPVCAFWGEDLRWEEGSLVFNLKEDSWPSRTWFSSWAGLTLGHSIIYAHYIKPKESGELHATQVHEHFHVKQVEGDLLRSFLMAWIPFGTLAAYGHWVAATIVGIVVWLSGNLLQGVANYLVAGLRGEDMYRDSAHEQAAYAVVYKWRRTGKRDT